MSWLPSNPSSARLTFTYHKCHLTWTHEDVFLAQSIPRRWAMRQLKRRREGSDRTLYRAARRLWEALGVKPRADQWQAAAVSKPSDEVTSTAAS